MNWAQPATIYFEADSARAIALQSALTQRGRRNLRFRGSEATRINERPAAPTDPGPVQTYMVAVQSDRELVAAWRALEPLQVKAWVTVVSGREPEQLALGEYLQLRGLV